MLGAEMNVEPYFQRVVEEIKRLDSAAVQALADAIYACYQQRRTVFIIGNGGSGANASHLCEDLGKGSLSLTDNTPYILAWGNDEGFDRVFSEQLKNLAEPGDLLIAISGSGNSPNILRAVEWANAHAMKTFGCTGFGGGKLRALAHQCLHCAVDDMGIAETLHVVAFHWVVDNLYGRIALGK